VERSSVDIEEGGERGFGRFFEPVDIRRRVKKKCGL
jgi:hypothetical protein